MKYLSKNTTIVLMVICLIWACADNGEDKTQLPKKPNNTLFSLLPSDSTGITFVNSVKNSNEMNIFKYRNFYNGGGVAIGDINNDGLADIYMTGNMVANKLYLNKGNLVFEDISRSAGVEGDKPCLQVFPWWISMQMGFWISM